MDIRIGLKLPKSKEFPKNLGNFGFFLEYFGFGFFGKGFQIKKRIFFGSFWDFFGVNF